jgi:hypothetical protein
MLPLFKGDNASDPANSALHRSCSWGTIADGVSCLAAIAAEVAGQRGAEEPVQCAAA